MWRLITVSAALAATAFAVPSHAQISSVGVIVHNETALAMVYFTGERYSGFDLFVFPRNPPRDLTTGAHYRIGMTGDCGSGSLEAWGNNLLVDENDYVIARDLPLSEALGGLSWGEVRSVTFDYLCRGRTITVYDLESDESITDVGSDYQLDQLD